MTDFVATADHHDQRLDVVLAAHLGRSRAQAQKLIKAGAVRVNDQLPTVHQFLRQDDRITVTSLELPSMAPTATAHPSTAEGTIEIVAEHPDYLVVHKPSGLPVHPDTRYHANTLIQQLLERYPEINGVGDSSIRPGVIHRLDKDVSGLLVVARTQAMFDHLKSQFQARTVLKRYTALVEGHLTPDSGTIDFPIERGPNGLMVARPKNQTGRAAVTEYVVTERISHYSLLAVRLHTGRTHQIRVHCKAMGHPVIGDALYTVKKQKADRYPLNRLFLHAGLLGFADRDGNWQEFAAPLPHILIEYLRMIRPATHLKPTSGGRNIAISGSPGSGKSTLSKRLATELGYERISMGDIRRQLAAQRDMDLAAFNQWSESNPAGDVEVDQLWHEIAASGRGNIVAESRVAPYFLPNAIRVFLFLPTTEAAKRIWAHWGESKEDRNEDRRITSEAVLVESLNDRIASDLRRYVQYYGIDPADPIHYDLYLDVSGLDAEAEFQAVWQFVRQELAKK